MTPNQYTAWKAWIGDRGLPVPLDYTWAYMSPDRDGSDILISNQGRVIADLQSFSDDALKEIFGDAPAKDRGI